MIKNFFCWSLLVSLPINQSYIPEYEKVITKPANILNLSKILGLVISYNIDMIEAYLDIETTGLSPSYSKITVIGIHLVEGENERFVQLVGDDITSERLLKALEGVETIHTYNGSRFDLPFIQSHLGVDLAKEFGHCDLMYDCWQNNLYGGLKRVEQTLGIPRKLTEINGLEAVRLWWRYVNDYDQDALKTLCEYNREDVVNLKTLKEKVGGGKKIVKRVLRLSQEIRQTKIESYGNGFDLVRKTVEGLSKELLCYKSSAADWSIQEIIVHLADAEANGYIRLRRFIAEPGSRVMAYDQDRWATKLEYQDQNADESLEMFRLLRRTSYALLIRLPETVWTNTVQHSENGVMTLEDWLDIYEAHVTEHVLQIGKNVRLWNVQTEASE